MGYSYEQLKQMGATPGPAVSTPTNQTSQTTPKKKYTYSELVKSGATPITQSVPEEIKKPWLGEMAKSLISAPATMIARPFQAVAELAGVSDEAVNRFSKEHLGGIVAPTPQNFSDVKKDVGRGVETVALGLTPIAGGAAFGLGGSLEQGNDLFSVQTLLQTVVGAGAGKVIGLIGKPLMDVTGKVIGTITPKILKDVAMKGADAVAKFATQHEILPAVGKAAVNKLETGAQAVDTGVGKLFTGGKGKLGTAITNQYPGLSKENIQKHFTDIEQKALAKPTKQSGATFRDATKIYTDAKKQGYDLAKVATDNKIYNTDLLQDGKYNTVDAVNALRQETAAKGPDILRPALKEAEGGVARIPVSTVRDQMKAEIGRISKSKLTSTDRQKMLDAIDRMYSDTSPEALAHPDGYSLTDLYDNKIANSSKVTKGGFGAPLNAPTKTANTYYKTQSGVFRRNFLKSAPKELGADAFEKKLQERFMLADYLEKLNGRKAPTSLFQGAVKTGAKVSGAALGGSTGNVFGAFGGYHAGGMAVDSFMNASNPVKAAYLKEVQATEPEIFNAIREYIGDQQTAKLMRLQLPSGGKSSVPDLMRMQNASGAVEMGYTPKPITLSQTMANDIQQNRTFLNNTKQLPAPAPRTIVPNTQGTPNQPGVDYGTPEVRGMRQRIFNGVPKPTVSQKAAELTKKNGGVTINLKGDVPTKGFAYSPYKDVETVIPETKFSDSDIDNFVEKYYDRLNQEGHHLGVWVDNGKVYIDISKVNPDENAAVLDSLQNNQIGLFDLSNFETKYIKDYEKTGNTYIYKRKN